MDNDPTRFNPELLPADEVDRLRSTASAVQTRIREAAAMGQSDPFPGYVTGYDLETDVVHVIGHTTYGFMSLAYDLNTDVTNRSNSGFRTMYFASNNYSSLTGTETVALLFFGDDPYSDQHVVQWQKLAEDQIEGESVQAWLDNEHLDELQPTPEKSGGLALQFLVDMLAGQS